jgi:hypothetical protein
VATTTGTLLLPRRAADGLAFAVVLVVVEVSAEEWQLVDCLFVCLLVWR